MRNIKLSNIVTLIEGNSSFTFLIIINRKFGLGAYDFSFVLFKISDLGVMESFILLLYAVINISHTGIELSSRIFAGKIGKEEFLLLGYIMFLISSIIMIILYNNYVYAYIIGIIFGLYVGIVETLVSYKSKQYSF